MSPGFLMPPPALRHPERIPPDDLAAMQVSWQRIWFEPRPVRLIVLENVYVASEGLVFTRSLDVFEPSVKQHPQAEIAASRSAIGLGLATGSMPRLRDDVVLCRKRGAANYGHWLAEMLPKAWFALNHWTGPLTFLIQAVEQPLKAAMRDSLHCLGIHADACVETGPDPVLVDRLLVVDGLTEHGWYMSPLVLECLRAIAGPIAPATSGKLMVTRGPAASRRFVDEDEVMAKASRAGFELLDPASLPFREQVAAFKGARKIVGAMGSALANIAFAAGDAHVVTLAPAGMRDTFFWFLAGLSDLRYLEIRCAQQGEKVGPAAWDTSLIIDDAGLAECVDSAAKPDVLRPSAMRAVFAQFFDERFYRTRYPDIAEAAVDCLTHYLQHGWKEGRNPSIAFDTSRYLAAYPDVAAAQINPLLHYAMFGQSERRSTFPA